MNVGKSRFAGLHLGLVNVTDDMNGLQVGVVNIARPGPLDAAPVSPLTSGRLIATG